MGRIVGALGIAAIIAATFIACGGGGGGSSTPTQATPTVTGVTVTGPTTTAKPGDSAQFTATATLSNGTTQTVTNQATWQSSNGAVATVSSTGFVTATAAGEADIRATYQSVTGSAHVTVTAPEPPPTSLQTFVVSGAVKEESGGTPISGAGVSVRGTSLSTTSDRNGHYAIGGVSSGRFTLRATKSGYESAEVAVNVSANVTADIRMRKESGPTPPPDPNPKPGPNGATCDAAAYPSSAPCGQPTAVCNDGTFSCSQNRSGTCSTHGGVKCWLCPGRLCNGLVTGAELQASMTWTPAALCPLSARP